MYKAEVDVDVEADEHGIYDGRVIAQALLGEIMEFLIPYCEGDYERLAKLAGVLMEGAFKRAVDKDVAGDLEWWIACDEDITGRDEGGAMRAHCKETGGLTDQLVAMHGENKAVDVSALYRVKGVH